MCVWVHEKHNDVKHMLTICDIVHVIKMNDMDKQMTRRVEVKRRDRNKAGCFADLGKNLTVVDIRMEAESNKGNKSI